MSLTSEYTEHKQDVSWKSSEYERLTRSLEVVLATKAREDSQPTAGSSRRTRSGTRDIGKGSIGDFEWHGREKKSGEVHHNSPGIVLRPRNSVTRQG